ncbi:MAG: MCE family protein, partial [Acidimicrobiales bacterium]
MSVNVASPPRQPPPGAPPPGGRPPGGASPSGARLSSLESLQQSLAARAVLGLLLASAIVAVIWLILLAFTGHFTDVVKVDARLPAGSNAVPVGAPVQYRNVTVGKVASEAQAPGGGIAVRFDLYPDMMAKVPKGVTAEVEPLSIFGNQGVVLVPPATITPARLKAGTFIDAYTGAPSSSLQGTVTQLYRLLDAIHPASLDTALTNLGTALDGQGTNLGQALRSASQFFGALQPHLSTLQADLRLTVPVSQELQQATPDLLGTLSYSSVTGQTITAQAAQLHQLLTSGTVAASQLAGLLEQVQTTLPALADDSGPLLSDVTQNPQELALTLQGLGQFASALAQAESHGPFVSVGATLPVSNISSGVNAALGYDNPASIREALSPNVDPPTYTSANCPEYPGETNPYCGSGG